jgi:hypothetical protein
MVFKHKSGYILKHKSYQKVVEEIRLEFCFYGIRLHYTKVKVVTHELERMRKETKNYKKKRLIDLGQLTG